MPAPDINHISAKPVLSSHCRRLQGRTLTPVNEFDPGICRAITTRTPSVSWKNLFPGQIYPITAVMIEYE